MKISTGQEYAAKIINTKKLSARGEYTSCEASLLLGKDAVGLHFFSVLTLTGNNFLFCYDCTDFFTSISSQLFMHTWEQ